MKLNEIVNLLGLEWSSPLEVMSGANKLDNEVKGGYAGDLLSDVMANSKPGNIWITVQAHQNIVAVASLKDLSGIILVNQRKPDEETIEKAEKEGIPIMVTRLSSFEIIGRLYKLGIVEC